MAAGAALLSGAAQDVVKTEREPAKSAKEAREGK
jgi:hypothetical protein